ncbi:hypothetical protein ACFOY2_36540 [Nonomuraea purpurea]|uniref:Methyltransferase domain-containing protein n=1 Tax=Nonomuraea purpurea TaxID=1849276 RepID=A0ABV8GIL8_9ACTN
MTIESRQQVRRYFDAFGDAEWHRLTGDVAGRVSLEVHRRFLARFVRPGHRVLEVGAGPGRFTAELAALGASIVVNWATLGDPDALAALESDPDRWARFLEHEIAACQEPGALDGGTHILFACVALRTE